MPYRFLYAYIKFFKILNILQNLINTLIHNGKEAKIFIRVKKTLPRFGSFRCRRRQYSQLPTVFILLLPLITQ